MSEKLPSAIIFDWDNTLIDSWGAIADATNFTRKHFGQSVWTLGEVKANCTRSARDSFPEWFGEDWLTALDVFYRRFDEVQMKGLTQKSGAEKLLRWLKERQVPCFVVSNKNGQHLRRESKALGWTDLFVAIVGAQDATHDKPAREVVDFALRSTGIKAGEDVWFVGDSEVDMQCARNAGCTPVLIGDQKLAARLSVARVFSDCNTLQTLLYNHGDMVK
jgi:phosphoglycolate phosphatase